MGGWRLAFKRQPLCLQAGLLGQARAWSFVLGTWPLEENKAWVVLDSGILAIADYLICTSASEPESESQHSDGTL